MAIAVDVRTCEKVEGMPSVVSEDGREFKIREVPGLPRAGEDACDDDFMALVEFRESTISVDVGLIEWSVVTIEIGGVVRCFAVSVICNQADVRVKALLNFENSSLIESGCDG